MAGTPELVELPLWIDGERRHGGGDLRPDVDPSTGRAWAQTRDATADDVDAAVTAARTAFQSAEWRAMTSTQRAELVRRLGEIIGASAEPLAELETRDNGKALWHTRGEFAAVPSWYSYFAGAADKVAGRAIDVAPTVRARTVLQPLGVVAALTPFNSPFMLGSWKFAPALAAGNALVVKPSEDTPATTLELGRMAKEAGFPDGIVNVVTGGAGTGQALVAHPDVAMVSFTGSSAVAGSVAAAATSSFKRVVCEAGGKSPHIVFADANLEQALVAVAAGVFPQTGQTCVAGSRVLIEESIYHRFVAALVERAAQVRVGDPRDPATHIGPLASRRQLQRVAALVQSARDEGGDVLVGGGPPAHLADSEGFYFAPTLIDGLDNGATICQEEVFGPVAVLMPFRDEEHALRIANDSRYGLAAGVWTNDARRLARFADGLDAGTVWANCYRTFSWMLPFGGRKESGWGRENGLEGLEEYLELKTVVEDTGTHTPDPFGLPEPVLRTS